MADRPAAWLALSDGTVLEGRSVGAPGETWGEVVFNTSMAGYQEILTDPSYRGQIVTLTYPLIGNYGIVPEDDESSRPWAEGLVIRELSPIASNHRSRETLDAYLRRNQIVAIEGLDTRAVTRRLRNAGSMTGLITTEPRSHEALVERVRSLPVLEGRDLVVDVTRREAEVWETGCDAEFRPVLTRTPGGERRPRVAVLDYGVKRNILRSLVDCGFHVTVFPARTTAEEILAAGPHGVLLSNGPGDPRVLDYAAECVRGLIGKVPVFGICLGHQIMAKAIGAGLFKLKFGHHGANHPVRDLRTGRVAITSQNHGFAVDAESLAEAGAVVTHMNLNDDTISGFEIPGQRAFCVQFHPEAAPGPHDSLGAFDEFLRLVTATAEDPACR